MKHKLILLSLILPYLAISQVAKDTVTVLSPAQITAASPNDTANIYFVINNAWRKANFDSLYKYTRVKLLATGAITSAELAGALSDETGSGAAVFGTSPTISGATISGGSINNTPIGASTANTGAFTTVTASGNVTGAKLVPTDSIRAGYGLYRINANQVGINVNGFPPFRITDSGNWGITDENPQTLLNNFSTSARGGVVSSGYPILMFNETGLANPSRFVFGLDAQQAYMWGQAGVFLRYATNGVERMRIAVDGEANIGYGATDNGNYILQVNGQIFATNATIATSDERYKENIMPLQSGLAVIEKLNPVTYNFITDNTNNFSEYPEVGFIAQDVDRALSTESYAKSIVKNSDDSDPDSPMGIAAGNLIPLLVKAIQEQQAQIEQLKQRIIQLENK